MFPSIRRLRAAAFVVLIVAMSGCATCERHPVACAAATAIIAGSIAAAATNHGHHGPLPYCRQQPMALDCRPVQ